ncbi:MAG: hypothetical protein AAB729_00845 [Patescibacteria group bacterium]
MDLTKEHFDKVVGLLATKNDLQKAVLPLATKDQIEELTRMTKDGFDDVLDRLDVKERVQRLEKQLSELRTALHLS